MKDPTGSLGAHHACWPLFSWGTCWPWYLRHRRPRCIAPYAKAWTSTRLRRTTSRASRHTCLLLVYYSRDHFCCYLGKSRHLRSSTGCPVMKKHGFQCNYGIDGGQTHNELHLLVCVFHLIMYYYYRDHFCGSSSDSSHPRRSIRRPVMKKHGIQF